MSSGDQPEFVTPEQVEAERNLIRRIQNALGVETQDSDADDTLLAALVANSARTGELARRQTEMLSVLTGQPIDVEAPLEVTVTDPLRITPPDIEPDIEVVLDNLSPEITIPDDATLDLEGIEIDQQEITEAFQDAQMAIERRTLYSTSVSSSTDNLLSQAIRPMTDHSSFRVDVSLDTATTLSVRTDPDDDTTPFNETLNRGSTLTANAKREFQFDVDPTAKYNFRAGAAATFNTFRLVEVVVL